MSKLKRKRASDPTRGPPESGSKGTDDIEAIELEDDSPPEGNGNHVTSASNTSASRNGTGETRLPASKKKKLEVLGSSTSSSTKNLQKKRSPPILQPPTKTSDGDDDRMMVMDSEEDYYSAADDVGRRAETACSSGSSDYVTATASTSTSSHFKVPDVPRAKPRPDEELPPANDWVSRKPKVRKKDRKLEGNEVIMCTTNGRKIRKAFIDNIHDQFEVLAKGGDFNTFFITDITNLVTNLDNCTSKFPNLFATKIFPQVRPYEDHSRSFEIAEFTEWWLFGLLSLFFAPPKDNPFHDKEIKRLIRTIYQSMQNGHPTLVESLTPSILRLLSDLTLLHTKGKVTIRLTSILHSVEDFDFLDIPDHVEAKEFVYEIQLSPENFELVIRNIIESLSPIFPRISFYQPKHRHVILELLKRLLWKISPDRVSAVLSSFQVCLLPNEWYLTEDIVSSTIREILKSSASSMNPLQMQSMLQRYDLFESDTYLVFLENCGLKLLKTGLVELLHSYESKKLVRNGLLGVMTRTMLRLSNSSSKNYAEFNEEVVRFVRLVSISGLDVILHPLLAHILIQQLKKAAVEVKETSHRDQPIIKVSKVSSLWVEILQSWSTDLNAGLESQMRYLGEDWDTPSAIEKQVEKALLSTAEVTCLAAKIREGLADEENILFQFFDVRSIQKWAELATEELARVARPIVETVKKVKTYSTVLRTIKNLETCAFFTSSSSSSAIVKLLKELILIPSFPWFQEYPNMVWFPPKGRQLAKFISLGIPTDVACCDMLIAECVKTLRIDSFRPWRNFVSSVYTNLMESGSSFENVIIVQEILKAIAEVSWVMKTISLNAIFSFLTNILETQLWIENPIVRSFLGDALSSMPCICCYNLDYHEKTATDCPAIVPSKTGCQLCSAIANGESVPRLIDLPDSYAERIILLATPLLKSKFLLVKFRLTELIPKCNNHQKEPLLSIVTPMVEVALHGKTNLCEVVFRKIGMLLVEKDLCNMEASCSAKAEFARRLFSFVMPCLASRIKKKLASISRRTKLSLKMRAKILLAICELSSAGPISLAVFVEVVNFMLLILAESTLQESTVTVSCQKIVSNFADHHKCTTLEAISRIRNEVAKQFVKISLKIFCSVKGSRDNLTSRTKCLELLQSLKNVGGFRLNTTFVTYFLPPIIREIVPQLPLDSRCEILLSAAAYKYHMVDAIGCDELEEDSTNISFLLKKYMIHYIPSLLLDYRIELVNECVRYIKEKYKFDVIHLAQACGVQVLIEILQRYDELEDKANRSFKLFSNRIGNRDQSAQDGNALSQEVLLSLNNSSNVPRRTEIQELLDKIFLGFSISFDTKMKSRIESSETKQKVLRGYAKVIKTMGKSKMQQFYKKIYKTLISAAEQGPLLSESLLECWKEYTNNLDGSILVEMASQIIVAILPIREVPGMAQKVDGLIYNIVCFRKSVTSPMHKELYFLLDLDQCENGDVLSAITDTVTDLRESSWGGYFNVLLSQAKSDNVNIRYHAFLKLRKVFTYDFERLDTHILLKGEHVVSEVITVLLNGLRVGGGFHSDEEKIRLLIVDCFGYLGALDPSRFRKGTDEIASKKVKDVTTACQVVYLCAIYLQQLIREFEEAKDTAAFDYCACLIKIVIKETGMKEDDNDPIWKLLTNRMKATIYPLMSREDFKRLGAEKEMLPQYECPIYMSDQGKTFESWLVNWFTVLTGLIDPKRDVAGRIFVKSANVLRKNVSIASFVIPFIATYAVYSTRHDQKRYIIEEIKQVLDRWNVLEKRRLVQNIPLRDTETEFGLPEENEMSVETETVFHSRCTQIILTVLDHFVRLHHYAKRKHGLKISKEEDKLSSSPPVMLPLSVEDMKSIEQVLEEIPKLKISQVAFDYQSYTTALYFLEQELRDTEGDTDSKRKLQDNLDYLQRIYVSLNDMDAVDGISAIRKGDPSYHERVLESIAKGEVENSIKIMEQMSNEDPTNLTAHNALVQAYLSVEEPHKAEVLIRATLQRMPEWEVALQEVQFSTLLKLKKWDDLKGEVERIETSMDRNGYMEEKIFAWKIAIPRILSKMQQNQLDKAKEIVKNVKLKIVPPLVAISEELYPYKRAYNHIVQLQILTEIEEALNLLQKSQSGSSQKTLFHGLKRLMTKWNARLMNVCQSRKIINEILDVRKSVFELLRTNFQNNSEVCDFLKISIRECWLDIAKDASKCGNFTLADNCLLKAKEFSAPEVLIQEAKILKRKGKKTKALNVLDKVILDYYPAYKLEEWKNDEGSSSDETARILCSKALLLRVELMEELKLLNFDGYSNRYTEPAQIYKKSEKNHFALGSFYDRLWNAERKQSPNAWVDVQASIVRCYSNSLLYGCKYVYQSLPRLLSIWFDFSAESNGSASSMKGRSDQVTNRAEQISRQTALERMNNYISMLLKNVPAYILMTAFSQLVSRLCHQNDSTWKLLKEILATIIETHPYQALWMTMSVYKSVNSTREYRCREIFEFVKTRQKELKDVIKNYTTLTERIIGLCDKELPKMKYNKFSLAEFFPDLAKLLKRAGRVAIPFQNYMSPVLPPKGKDHKDRRDPFPETCVFIVDASDVVDVMPSLIRPKKISILGTNGKYHGLLCKPKDDLRKDSKVMEVNSVVNWYLSQNPESTQRRLHVRTFTVVPLNETCGVLEWVPNLQGLRVVLTNLYQEKNFMKFHRTQSFRNRIKAEMTLEEKRRHFLDMLKVCPPVLHEWFFNTFKDHQSWYAARMSYVRTAAVMSMVGYIMGLGDRHGENILLDTITGEVVHVDFNCIFSKGEVFQWKERVPFRLTHNMVDAMGPLGVEGPFRKTCEVVMRMFREHQTIFMSVLRPFVFDPLVDWDNEHKLDTKSRKLASLETGEKQNREAAETVLYIMRRLEGTARTMKNDIDAQLSVEAFVDYLINDATCIDNLCRMFSGWAAFY